MANNLVFHAEGGVAAVSVDVSVPVVLNDGRLSAGGPVLATQVKGVWRIGELALERITCSGPVTLEVDLSGESRRFGPLTDVVIGHNTIWTSAGAFARYNAFTKAWSLTDGTAVQKPVQKLAAA